RIAEPNHQRLGGLRYREQRKEGNEGKDQGEQRETVADIGFHAASSEYVAVEALSAMSVPFERYHFFRSRHEYLRSRGSGSVVFRGRAQAIASASPMLSTRDFFLPHAARNCWRANRPGVARRFQAQVAPAPDIDAIGPACRGQTPVHRPHKTDQ